MYLLTVHRFQLCEERKIPTFENTPSRKYSKFLCESNDAALSIVITTLTVSYSNHYKVMLSMLLLYYGVHRFSSAFCVASIKEGIEVNPKHKDPISIGIIETKR